MKSHILIEKENIAMNTDFIYESPVKPKPSADMVLLTSPRVRAKQSAFIE